MMCTNIKQFNILYQNVRGMRKKLRSIYTSILSEYRYTIYRSDRNQQVTGRSKGRDVLIAVKSKYNSEVFHRFQTSFDGYWIKTKINSQVLNICTIYS